MTDVVDRMGEEWLEEAGLTQEPEATEEPEQEAPKEAKEDQPEPEEKAEEPEKPEPEKSPHMVPYGELKSERQKRQAAEAELQRREQQQQQPVQIPDAYEDREGFENYIRSREAQIQWNTNVELSKFKAETKHGEDKVKEAIVWAQQEALVDPTFDQRIGASSSPVEFVVSQYQQSRTLKQLAGAPFEEAARAYAEKQGWIVSEQGEQPQPKPVSSPPRSLAKVPSAGASPKTNGADWDIFSSNGMGLKGR